MIVVETRRLPEDVRSLVLEFHPESEGVAVLGSVEVASDWFDSPLIVAEYPCFWGDVGRTVMFWSGGATVVSMPAPPPSTTRFLPKEAVWLLREVLRRKPIVWRGEAQGFYPISLCRVFQSTGSLLYFLGLSGGRRGKRENKLRRRIRLKLDGEWTPPREGMLEVTVWRGSTAGFSFGAPKLSISRREIKYEDPILLILYSVEDGGGSTENLEETKNREIKRVLEGAWRLFRGAVQESCRLLLEATGLGGLDGKDLVYSVSFEPCSRLDISARIMNRKKQISKLSISLLLSIRRELEYGEEKEIVGEGELRCIKAKSWWKTTRVSASFCSVREPPFSPDELLPQASRILGLVKRKSLCPAGF